MATKTSKPNKNSESEWKDWPPPEPLSSHLLKILEPTLSRNPFPPVLLITGTQGIGKRVAACLIAQWHLCNPEPSSQDLFGSVSTQPSVTPRPCGVCTSCHRALSGNWIDFTEIAPEDEGSGSIKIERFRDLKASAGFGAHEGPYRIVLIRDAERMTPQAANSLLKILEEPPPQWLFLLTASDSTLLLPTLLSRCQKLRLPPLPIGVVQALLEQQDFAPERAQLCAKLGQGSWRKAFELGQDLRWEKRQSVSRFLVQPQAELNALVDWAALEPRNFTALLDQLESLIADLIQWSLRYPDSKNYQWNNLDAHTQLTQHVTQASKRIRDIKLLRSRWFKCAETVSEVRKKISAPLNRKLLAQETLFPWLDL